MNQLYRRSSTTFARPSDKDTVMNDVSRIAQQDSFTKLTGQLEKALSLSNNSQASKKL